MNTERLAAVDRLRQARRAMAARLDKIPDSDPNHDKVQAVVDALEDAQDQLFIKDLTKRVSELKKAANRLKKVNDAIRKDTGALKKAAERVKVAAKAIGTLADIVAAAAAL